MEFRLLYNGELKSKSSVNAKVTQALRRAFHPQLKMLWDQEPLAGFKNHLKPAEPNVQGVISLLEDVGDFQFAPLVSSRWATFAEVDVLFLRPSPPGSLVRHGGDLDNRIKTLMDGLRMPQKSELPVGDTPGPSEIPFFCLLQDDALVTSLSVRTDRLLYPRKDTEVELIIHVKVKVTTTMWGNIGIAS